MKKRLFSALVCFALLFSALILPVSADGYVSVDLGALELNCESAVLMEAATGAVLYAKNGDLPLPPASVTKIMTLLLVMEAIDSGALKLTDTVTASAHACSMGGSQIYLKEGEQMCVEDLVKSVVIASANDAAVALAEHIAGSEEVFVARMNARAAELGMKNTNFENTNGLDDTASAHYTSAYDIALMSRELIKHKTVLKYSSTWMDSVRNGAFGLTNTNRLVRFYSGCTGLKTGSTSKAKFCVSATAERDGTSLIAVIMASPSRDERNAAAKSLLDWGFANYSVYRSDTVIPESVRVKGGTLEKVRISFGGFCAAVPKGKADKVTYTVDLPDALPAPVEAGDKVGTVTYTLDGEEIGKIDVISEDKTDKIGFFSIFIEIFRYFLMKK